MHTSHLIMLTLKALWVLTRPELLHNPLYLLSVEVGQLSAAQRQTTHKLVLCDDTTSKLVVVFEELCGPNAILVHHVPDFGKYLIQR